MALTGKKLTFASAVLAGLSNRDAAVQAGYSATTASAAGSRLAKDPAVIKFLSRPGSAGAAAQVVSKAASAPAPRRKPAPNPAPDPVPPAVSPAPPASTFDLATALMHTDPKAYLIAAMNDGGLEQKLRIDAAKALMPFVHKKLGEGGKKEQKDEDAKRVAGRFSTAAPPKLVATGGKKV